MQCLSGRLGIHCESWLIKLMSVSEIIDVDGHVGRWVSAGAD